MLGGSQAPSPILPPHLVSLIHHVELNKVGWLPNAVRRIILSTLWVTARPLSAAELATELRQRLSLELDTETVNRHLESLGLVRQ